MAAANSAGPKSSTDLKALVEHGYDAVAPHYLAWVGRLPTTTRLAYIEKLATLLPPGSRVLELGCGAGVPSTQILVGHGFDVTGVDISAAQIALARARVPGATLVRGDMTALSFAPASFDEVVGFYSIFHLPKEEQGAMVGRIQGWLKEGGWLLFNLHAAGGDVLREDWMGVPMFSSGLGVDGNREMMRKHGEELTVVEDEVAVEKIGSVEERFHWVMAVKGKLAKAA